MKTYEYNLKKHLIEKIGDEILNDDNFDQEDLKELCEDFGEELFDYVNEILRDEYEYEQNQNALNKEHKYMVWG